MEGKLVAVSACLLGIGCRYDGKGKEHPAAMELLRRGLALPLCPEQLGGLPTPRIPAELRGGRVISREGADVTDCFLKGAAEALRICRLAGVRQALLKERSPSCGTAWIYDGSFSGRLIPGSGIAARLLIQAGIQVFSDQDPELERLWMEGR